MRGLLLVALFACSPVTDCGPCTADAPRRNPQRGTMNDEQADAARAEIERLTSMGQHDLALARTLVYHHGSVGTSHDGVRLSFALSDWLELAQKYQPALDALRRTRDDAREEVLTAAGDCAYGPDLFEYFHEFESLNDVLGEEHLTAELFLLVEAQDSKRAECLYHVAEPALVKGGHFGRASKYLDPESDWASAVDRLRMQREFEGKHQEPALEGDPVLPKTADRFFAQRMTTLIALLAVNGRNEEAAVIASRAKATLPDESFHAAVAKALQGQVPDPWP